MEFKLAAKFIAFILSVYAILICVSWYTTMDYVKIVKEENRKHVTHKELLTLTKSYNVSLGETYIWKNSETVKYTKENIPFCFKKEVISRSKPELVKDQM